MNFLTRELNYISKAWKQTWNRGFLINLLSVLICGSLMMIFVPGYFDFIQKREGILLNDILLDQLPSKDLSWFIFPIIHFCTILTLINLSYYPETFLAALQTYILVTLARLTCIYFVALEPPAGIILLIDPVNEKLFYGNQVITKDLFFSGHTAAQFLLFLVVQNKYLKYLFFVLTVALIVMILIQHVHYTIDMLAAPVFVWVCYKAVLKVNKKTIGLT